MTIIIIYSQSNFKAKLEFREWATTNLERIHNLSRKAHRVLKTIWSVQKRLIAQLRTGNHKLRIETGRHCKPSLPPEQRVCLHCNAACTEDEKHFLAECNAYSEIRKKYLPCEPDNTVDFVNCMTSKDCESLNNLSQYLQEAWDLRAGMDQ